MPYIGTPGRMIQIYSTPSLDESTSPQYSLQRTLEGRVKAQRRPLARRSWSMRAEGAFPQDQAVLREFAHGAWGKGPFVFLAPDALTVNALTPSATRLEAFEASGGFPESPPVAAGPWLTPDGWAPVSYLKDVDTTIHIEAGGTPAIPGRPVTASCYVRGVDAAVRIDWFDYADALIGSSPMGTASAGTVIRSHVTDTPPANAAYFHVYLNHDVLQWARPAVTFTSGLREYGDGRGCRKAVVLSYEQTLRRANAQTWADSSFTIQEVG